MAGRVTELETQGLVPTNAQMLVEINKAILTILQGAQSYQIGSRKITRADLSQLYKMRQELESGMNADDNKTGLFDDTYVAIWDTDPR